MDLWDTKTKDLRESAPWKTGTYIETLGGAVGAWEATIFEDPPWVRADRIGRRRQPTQVALSGSPMDLANDATMRTLITWVARNPRVRVIIANGRQPNETRTGHLALCRNVLLREALRSRAASMMVLDLDCKPSLQPSHFREAVGAVARPRASWHVLTLNSAPHYYDYWALRAKSLHMDYDCLKDRKAIYSQGSCWLYRTDIDPRARLFAVESAFNGGALYGLRAVGATGCAYSGRDAEHDRAICEHVPFHLCLGRHGLRQAIVPWMISGCGWEVAKCSACNESLHAPLSTLKHLRLLRNGSRLYSPPARWTDRLQLWEDRQADKESIAAGCGEGTVMRSACQFWRSQSARTPSVAETPVIT